MSERWKPVRGETYYYVDSVCDVDEYTWSDDSVDDAHYKSGNCFRSEEKAKAAGEKIKDLLLSLHEQRTECNQLPKLTVEVFDREECPAGANWAAVDQDGTGIYFSSKPSISPLGLWWDRTIDQCPIGTVAEWDASDWQNSLIERTSKLPDWCKVGERVYDEHNGYGRVIATAPYEWCTVEFDYCKYYTAKGSRFDRLKKARIRPFNTKEMKALVGRTVSPEYGTVFLVTKFFNTKV